MEKQLRPIKATKYWPLRQEPIHVLCAAFPADVMLLAIKMENPHISGLTSEQRDKFAYNYAQRIAGRILTPEGLLNAGERSINYMRKKLKIDKPLQLYTCLDGMIAELELNEEFINAVISLRKASSA